jgi:patatin-related protein
MYGGVSLAIYMNGITQELLRMVRATAADEDLKPLVCYDDLDLVEKVYRKAAYSREICPGDNEIQAFLNDNAALPRKFVIDIISGTSAGGINGIFLAKALANGLDIDELKKLWIREGDVNLLINDRKSIRGTGLSLQHVPQSLFNSQRMYSKLFEAFRKMEREGGEEPGKRTNVPLVDKLDLFVTATDILGLTLPIKLSDRTVYERRHRTVFRFSCNYGKGLTWNDFKSENNPFLAFAARCTSSFPFAFEPMRLSDLDEIFRKGAAENAQWKRFFKGYPDKEESGKVMYHRRSFGDGGYLDNRPFSYAIEAISGRRTDYPIERKLLYIEPVPEHPEKETEREDKPDVLENSLDALLKLPRYETIREDLEKIIERNRLNLRIERILADMEQDRSDASWKPQYEEFYREWADSGRKGEEPLWAKPQLDDREWGTLDLIDMTRRNGPGYIAYHRLEISAVTDDFGRLLARVAGFEENSDYFLVFRDLARAWRKMTYIEKRTGEGMEEKKSLNAFLHTFDLTFPMRRLKFLLRQIDRLYLGSDQRIIDEVSFMVTRMNTREEDGGGPFSPENGACDAQQIRKALLGIKKRVNTCLDSLEGAGRTLRLRFAPRKGARRDNPDEATVSGPLFVPVSHLLGLLVNNPDILMAASKKRAKDDADRLSAGKKEREDAFAPVLDYFLQNKSDSVSIARGLSRGEETPGERKASGFLENNRELIAAFDGIREVVNTVMTAAIEESDHECRKLLGMEPGADYPDVGGGEAVRAILKNYYRHYTDFDRVIFPMIYGTGINDTSQIDILRISPEDAAALVDEEKMRLKKLSGRALGNFGAFMEKRWRQNDIMWGQLDGAERMLTAIAPDKVTAGRLTGEVQAAIVLETMMNRPGGKLGRNEILDLLCEPFMHTQSGTPDEQALSEFIGKLKTNAGPLRQQLDELIDDGQLRDHYIATFRINKSLEPGNALKNAARATTVTGKILSGIAEKNRLSGRNLLSLITWAGTFFVWLLEAAVPRSMASLVFSHWIKLLYLLETVLFALSFLFVNDSVQRFALVAFTLTLAVQVTVIWLNSILLHRKKFGGFIKGIAMFAVLSLVISGVLFFLVLVDGEGRMWKYFSMVHRWFAG